MKKLIEIPRSDGTTLEFLLAQMELTRKYLLKEVKDITTDELDFTPDITKFETIGTMLFHIADAENSWIFEHIEGDEIDFEFWKWSFPLRLELDPIQRTGKPVEFYLKVLKDTREKIFEYLKNFKDEDRLKIFESEMGRTTLEWVLFHVHRHEQHHIGQINILRRLYKKNK